ncbi:unnamed protein product [Lactuca virosa]|uniref:Uncharacterized protein n=1 Tax=Lactuca virosa TaxID=75947 RepID=A0AAU9PGN3_9ASTR|nr:unnamed protein product [Lactuca virosa]
MNVIIDSLPDLHSVQSPDRLIEINATITVFNHWFDDRVDVWKFASGLPWVDFSGLHKGRWRFSSTIYWRNE